MKKPSVFVTILQPLYCHHILASLSNRKLISFSSCLIRCTLPSFIATCSAFARSFLFFSNSRLTLPKLFLLHLVSSFPHLSTFFITLTSSALLFLVFQIASIVFSQPFLCHSHLFKPKRPLLSTFHDLRDDPKRLVIRICSIKMLYFFFQEFCKPIVYSHYSI